VTLAVEEARVRKLFDLVEAAEEAANSLDPDNELRTRLFRAAHAVLADEATIRPVIAADLLGLSEKTVRAWAAKGVLTVVRRNPRMLLDTVSVHLVSHLVRDIRAAGKDRDLLDEVWQRLSDQALLDRDDLKESLEQMRQGKGRVLRPLPR